VIKLSDLADKVSRPTREKVVDARVEVTALRRCWVRLSSTADWYGHSVTV